MFPIRKILHPTDFSELSRPAFELACSLAKDYSAELVLCHTYLPAMIPVGEGMLVELPPGEAEELAARLEGVKPADPRIAVTHRFLRGNPAEEILKLAHDVKVDLIVLGTHGRSGISRLLMGSVAEEVMRQAPCLVVTVKTQLPTEQPRTPAKETVSV